MQFGHSEGGIGDSGRICEKREALGRQVAGTQQTEDTGHVESAMRVEQFEGEGESGLAAGLHFGAHDRNG